MGTIAIFPSLTRAPGLDSSEMSEDDTIRDKMESGYVATRPRGTRARRTWNVNVRNLPAEDARAIAFFRTTVVQRGALPFFYPNLLRNGSFEYTAAPGSANICSRWSATAGTRSTIATSPLAYDGSASLVFTFTGADSAAIQCDELMTVRAGESYLLVAWANVTAKAGTASLIFTLNLTFDDGTAMTASGVAALGNPGSGWAMYGVTLLMPTPVNGRVNATALASITVSSSSTSTLQVDNVGAAQVAAAVPQLQMVGTNSIPAPVRFPSGGLPKLSDMGWAAGAKVYGATFQLEEV